MCKGCLSGQDISPNKSKALDSHALLEYAKVVWWSGHLSWQIRGSRLTIYVKICKGCLSNQDISSEKSRILDSQPILEHAKVVWVIRTSLLKNQRHWTHNLCWNMQRLFLSISSWEIRGTGLTCYVGTCKSCLSNQNIPPEKSEALDSPPMLEHAKFVWVIRTSLLKNQRHWTHILCKHCLRDQNIPPDKSEALDSHTMLEYAKVVWVIRTSLLRNQRHWTHKLYRNMQRLFEWSGYLFWQIRGTGLTCFIGTYKVCLSDQDIWEIRGTELTYYVGICKGCLSNQNTLPEKAEALGSPTILEHAKVFWLIRTSLLRNRRH